MGNEQNAWPCSTGALLSPASVPSHERRLPTAPYGMTRTSKALHRKFVVLSSPLWTFNRLSLQLLLDAETMPDKGPFHGIKMHMVA